MLGTNCILFVFPETLTDSISFHSKRHLHFSEPIAEFLICCSDLKLWFSGVVETWPARLRIQAFGSWKDLIKFKALRGAWVA